MEKAGKNKKAVWGLSGAAVILILAGITYWFFFSQSERPIRTIYLSHGDSAYLMIDQENGTVFTVTMPDKIYDQNGKKITQADLKSGNILNIYGNGIMLESYPGQYPGVSEIRVIEKGSAADAEPYQEILNQIWPEKDPAELPCLNVEYKTSFGVISAAAMEGSYRWTYTDENGTEQSIQADSPSIMQRSDLPVLNVDGDTDMVLYFDVLPERVWAVKYPAAETGTASESKGEKSELQKEGETYVLPEAQKGFLYQIRAEWENSQVEYGFLVK